MKLKGNYFFTQKEDVKDEESISANLLVRSGMIKKVGSGIYTFLPMGLRVLKNIEEIVREEMNAISSNELVMPSILQKKSMLKVVEWKLLVMIVSFIGSIRKTICIGTYS